MCNSPIGAVWFAHTVITEYLDHHPARSPRRNTTATTDSLIEA
ncbi:MAG: hypothetical protein WCG47_03320 [Dermatophilaceae bacterium]